MVEPNSTKKENSWTGCLLVIAFILVFLVLMFLTPITGAGVLFVFFIYGGFILLGLSFSQKRVLHIIVICLGIGLLVGSGFSYFHTQSFISNSIVTEGIVVRYESSGSGDEETYYAVISFDTTEGDLIHFEEHDWQNPSLGEVVKVIYDPNNPSDAKMYTWFALWSWTVVMFCVGIAAIVIATLKLLRHRRKQTKEQQYALI